MCKPEIKTEAQIAINQSKRAIETPIKLKWSIESPTGEDGYIHIYQMKKEGDTSSHGGTMVWDEDHNLTESQADYICKAVNAYPEHEKVKAENVTLNELIVTALAGAGEVEVDNAKLREFYNWIKAEMEGAIWCDIFGGDFIDEFTKRSTAIEAHLNKEALK